jgi:hypothetical protein
MTISIDGIELPSDLQWVDEFSGHGVGQVITPTLTGALLVEEVAQTKGRPITLASNGAAWVQRSVVEQLQALAATPLPDDTTLPFVWDDGRTFDVVFDRSRGPGFSATEVVRRAGGIQTSAHWYTINITLLTA